MSQDVIDLPDPQSLLNEIAELRRALSQRDALLEEKATQITKLSADVGEKTALITRLADDVKKKAQTIEQLRQDLNQLSRQLFGQKAERIDPNQLRIAFEQTEATGEEPPSFVEEAPDDESEPPKKRRRRRQPNGRGPLPKSLPRERVLYEPDAHELACACGSTKRPIGEEVSEQLEYVPASFKVIEHVRTKYACSVCQEGVVCAPLPPFPIEKGRPGPGLLAELIVNKYGDHLPLNRLEGIFARHGVRLAKSTLADWIRDSADLLRPIADEIGREVLRNDIAQTDETGIRVRDPTIKGRTHKGRIWIYAGQPGQLHYRYSPTKETKHPAKFLEDFAGYLQADAYSGFDRLYRDGRIVEVACWAHARRKFWEAKDTFPIESAWALLAIKRLFAVEREANETGLSPEERLTLRRERSVPVATRFFAWLESLQPTILPRTPLAKAVRYALNQREALCRFLEDGRLKLDNNRAELALRQVAVGRKNWLFAGSANGAHRAAVLYSLVMSSRELGISPFDYLRDVIDKVANLFPAHRISELTPRGWQAAR